MLRDRLEKLLSSKMINAEEMECVGDDNIAPVVRSAKAARVTTAVQLNDGKHFSQRLE